MLYVINIWSNLHEIDIAYLEENTEKHYLQQRQRYWEKNSYLFTL